MRKRLLFVFLLVVLVALSAYHFYKPAGTPSKIDVHNFDWSGEYEGEIVEVKKSDWPTSVIGPVIPPFRRFSLAKGIDEVIQRYQQAPLLPTWLPEGMRYADVYIGPVVIICYSDREVEDFRFANITIEISPSSYRVPSPEDLNRTLRHGEKLIQVGNIWVELVEKAHFGYPEVEEAFGPSPLAWFSKDGIYYMVGVKSPLTPQDLIKIIENMTTLH